MIVVENKKYQPRTKQKACAYGTVRSLSKQCVSQFGIGTSLIKHRIDQRIISFSLERTHRMTMTISYHTKIFLHGWNTTKDVFPKNKSNRYNVSQSFTFSDDCVVVRYRKKVTNPITT